MKKIILLLVALPIFLITSLNMYSGFDEIVHEPYLKSLTCSSCHATIVNGIIIGGKGIVEDDYINVSIEFNDNIDYEAVLLNIKGIKNPKLQNALAINENIENALFSLDLKNDLKSPNKKANVVYLKYLLSEIEDGKEITIEGVFTNADGTDIGERSFSKKFILNEENNMIEKNKEIILFPSIANNLITIKNLNESASISIFDYSGKTMFFKNNIRSKEIIDVSSFPNGFYFANVSNEKTIKFIVKK